MPTSRPNHLAWLSEEVIRLKPKSILDIGIGFGSKGMLFREYTDVWYGNYFEWKTRIDGVEIFPEYVTDLQRKIYDNIYIGDIRTIVDTLGHYDLVYMGDVIEHLPKEDGLELLHKLKTKCKNLIISTPIIVSSQGAVYDNINETHVSEWKPIEFGKGVRTLTFGNIQIITWEKPTVYYCSGMSFYGERLERMGFGKYDPLKSALFVGLYFDQDFEVYRNHIGMKYVFWNGSDVSRLLRSQRGIQILHDNPATHICHNEMLRKELATVGIDALVEPIFFADINDYKTSFTPSKQMGVYINAHPGREIEYGIPWVLMAAKRLPQFKFYIYGVEGKSTQNVQYMGWVDEKVADEGMGKCHICLRLNHHDGLSQLVCKAALWGHYVITTLDMENTTRVRDVGELIEKIGALQGTVQPQITLKESLIKGGLNRFCWL